MTQVVKVLAAQPEFDPGTHIIEGVTNPYKVPSDLLYPDASSHTYM